MVESQAKYFSVLSGHLEHMLLIKINQWQKSALSDFVKSGKMVIHDSIKFLNIDFLVSNWGKFVSRLATLIVIVVFAGMNSNLF